MMTSNNIKRVMIIAFAFITVIILMTSCADVSHVQKCLPETEHTYGFWGGAWHGTISIPSFIGELFSDDIAIYAVNNNGRWYDFGYVLGLGGAIKLIGFLLQLLFAGLSSSTTSTYRRRHQFCNVFLPKFVQCIINQLKNKL